MCGAEFEEQYVPSPRGRYSGVQYSVTWCPSVACLPTMRSSHGLALAAAALSSSLSALSSSTDATAAPAPPPLAKWKNSSTGIHAFLTFDSGATLPAIAAFGNRIDYVWGADSKPEHIAAWRKVNPNIVLSHYIPFTRDPAW